MWQCIVTLNYNKEKVKERNWARISLAMFGNANSKWMSVFPTGILPNLNLFRHYVETCYTHEKVLAGGSIKGIRVPWEMSCMCSVASKVLGTTR